MTNDSTTIAAMTLEESRDETRKCDEEIQSIKAALRGLGSDDEQNSLEIEFTKVEGLPEAAKPTVKLQLSAPIEEYELSLEDGKTKATFSGVETSLAMLTVDARDAEIPLGAAANPIEVAPFCAMDDPKEPKKEYVTEVPVPIVAAPSETEGEKSEGDEAEGTSVPPVCTVTLRVVYKPSSKDQREELYELLNKTSQRKADALSVLRKRTIEKARAGIQGSPGAMTKPSVRPGFLNKGRAKAEEPEETGILAAAKKLYKRVVSPDSIVMKTAILAIVTKDFWIFFGAVGLMHTRGNLLALPPPA